MKGWETMLSVTTIKDKDGNELFKSAPQIFDPSLNYALSLDNLNYEEKDATLIERRDGMIVKETKIKVRMRKENA